MVDTIDSLKSIWKKEIREDHENGMFINEHALQAAMYHHIRTHGEARVVVEVTKFMMDEAKGIPDMVVFRDYKGEKTVEAVLELKCQASAIEYEKDIKKLATWAAMVDSGKCCKDVFEMNPKTLCWADDGEAKYKSYYKFTADTQWIFAAIGPAGPAFDTEELQKVIRRVGPQALNANFWLFSRIIEDKLQRFDTKRL